VFWFEEMKSPIQVQRKFHTQYRMESPNGPIIFSWHKNFVETRFSGSHAKSSGRPRVSYVTVEQLRDSFI
jgi:hypothetical protein